MTAMLMLSDFHSHILPGIDDGCRNPSESLILLRMQRSQNVERVVLTPHFYPNYDAPKTFLRRRNDAFHALLDAKADEKLPKMILGAEVYYFPGISECEELNMLTIGDGRYVLVEMPMGSWSERMYRELEGIYTKQGLTPILAHLNRYISPLWDHGIVHRLESLPVLVQANAEFFLNRRTASYARKLLRQGRIHVLGSDCHNMTDRAPNLGAAVETIGKSFGGAMLARIQEQENQILSARKVR